MAKNIEKEIEEIWDVSLQDNELYAWLGAWSGMNEDLILYAVRLTKENTGKASFKYADAILKNWERKGIKTLAEAEKVNAKFSGKKSKKKDETADSISRADILSFIHDIQSNVPKYMQSKAEKAGFINACCQIKSYIEHK